MVRLFQDLKATIFLIWVRLQIGHLPLRLSVQQPTVSVFVVHFCIIFVSLVPYIYYVPYFFLIILLYLRGLFSPLCFLLLLFFIYFSSFSILLFVLSLFPSLFYFCFLSFSLSFIFASSLFSSLFFITILFFLVPSFPSLSFLFCRYLSFLFG